MLLKTLHSVLIKYGIVTDIKFYSVILETKNYLSCTKYWRSSDVFKTSLVGYLPFSPFTLPWALPSPSALVVETSPPTMAFNPQDTWWDQPTMHVLIPPTLWIYSFSPGFKRPGSWILWVWWGSHLSCIRTAPGTLYAPQSESHWGRRRKERARRRDGVAGGKAKNVRRPRDAISVEKYDFPLFQLSILLKENDSVLKMMNERGGKDGENEWIDKWVNPLNHCTCTVFFHSRFQVISWGYH